MGSMKKWIYILILLPVTAMAGESAVGNFLSKLFPSTSQNVNSTVNNITAPADGSYLSNAITNTLAPAPQQQIPQQNIQMAPAQTSVQLTPASVNEEKIARENLVRCMYLGAQTDKNEALSQDSNEAQDKAKSAKTIYEKSNCNDQLKDYTYVFKSVDRAINTCLEGEDCQTAQLTKHDSAGGLKK